ncbi:MAG: GntR family transcriptional regulator [Candidatus Eremiobacteraeota bacterium]|nr:GntR family transcriptional regulator [Candidatus Eremiobacteraeota bacterium]MBV9402378.1 GntR family transcriptional regulator [Candidatus Eremiobacteraeota bacterium]MBV9973540.1 GntR family transcriptional regulator [Candidatus Eremiobacteraeota bacterium]
MASVFTVDPRSGVPIYLQLIEQVKRLVAVGALAPGEQLPTVKQLALDLTINPNTVARAYRELERDAVIETSPGRGSFIRADGALDVATKTRDDVAGDAFNEAVRQAKSFGLSRSTVDALFEQTLERWFPKEEAS